MSFSTQLIREPITAALLHLWLTGVLAGRQFGLGCERSKPWEITLLSLLYSTVVHRLLLHLLRPAHVCRALSPTPPLRLIGRSGGEAKTLQGLVVLCRSKPIFSCRLWNSLIGLSDTGRKKKKKTKSSFYVISNVAMLCPSM